MRYKREQNPHLYVSRAIKTKLQQSEVLNYDNQLSVVNALVAYFVNQDLSTQTTILTKGKLLARQLEGEAAKKELEELNREESN